jgi:hypothetical protein
MAQQITFRAYAPERDEVRVHHLWQAALGHV